MANKPVQSAREQLLAALHHGLPVHYRPPLPSAQTRTVRHSAVLVLFGELDRVDAHAAAEVTSVAPELDVLLTRRAETLRHHPGQVAFPGGGVEAQDRNRADTALREAYEETGLNPAGVEVLGELEPLWVPVSHNLVTPVIGWWTKPSDLVADRAEAVSVARVPVAELLDPANRGLSELVRPDGSVFRAPAFQLGPQHGSKVVWGLTAMILSSIFEGTGWSVPWSRARRYPV